jgi:NADP-dependent 3-hydroxy acid dehydrogenase YdfG
MSNNFEGKIVVITGASSGLGEATARLFSAQPEVKPFNIRTTVISPGAGATELPNSVTEPDIAERIHKFYEEIAIPADSFARAVAFAMSQPEDVDVNEILFRPTRQEL